MTGPNSPVDPATADHTPMAVPRRSRGKMRVMMLSGCGLMSDPPSPCSARNAMSHSMVGANAQAKAAVVNTAMPTR